MRTESESTPRSHCVTAYVTLGRVGAAPLSSLKDRRKDGRALYRFGAVWYLVAWTPEKICLVVAACFNMRPGCDLRKRSESASAVSSPFGNIPCLSHP
jgi:hypothetical protein